MDTVGRKLVLNGRDGTIDKASMVQQNVWIYNKMAVGP